MRSFTGIILAAALAVLSPGPASATTAFTVIARNPQGQPMADVTVAAVNFGMNGPSTYTVIGKTLADGATTLYLSTGTTGVNYELFYSSHGFSPTMQDQFNNPDSAARHYYIADTAPVSSTVTFTGALAEVGRIALEFIGATPDKALFGGVNHNALQTPGPQGIAPVDGAGAGTLTVDNVPYSAANTYNIGLYDPEKNKGTGRGVISALDSGAPLISYIGADGVDFDQAIAPTRIENTAAQNSDGGSGLSVQGVVRSTEANWVAIPHNNVNFRSCFDNPWAHVDENGAFQLYNLTPGVTYYAEANGGCAWNQQGSVGCFEPYRSPALMFTPGSPMPNLCTGPTPGINDFLYISSSSIQTVHIKLNRVPASTGQIRVYVKSVSGVPIPNANVNLNPDSSGWSKDGCAADPQTWNTVFSSQGFSNANVNVSAAGYALLDGLPSGNYMLNVWTPFSPQDNNPPINDVAGDGFDWDWSKAHCTGTGADDIRIAVDTNTTPSLHVYNNVGAELGLSSITVMINTGLNTSGEVKGTLTFTSTSDLTTADLTTNPVMITLEPNCGTGNCGFQGNFAMINSSGAASYPYLVKVSSGFSYRLDLASKGWGQVGSGGEDEIHLQASSSVVKNFNFIPAGTITGTLNKPLGVGVYRPTNNECISIMANVSGGGCIHGELAKDGTYTLEGAIPGSYSLSLNYHGHGVGGSFPYALPMPGPTVTVAAGRTSTLNLDLVNATYMSVDLDTSTVPDATIMRTENDTLLGFKAIPLPAGTMFSAVTLTSLLLGDDQDYGIRYSTPTVAGDWGDCSDNWPFSGFCASRIPSPGVYDVYLLRFANLIAGLSNMYPHFVILNSIRNVILDPAHAVDLVPVSSSPYTGLVEESGVLVNLTPAVNMSERGNATLFGAVTANNFFRQADYDTIGGDFNKFMQFLPLVSLYDEAGKLNAAGAVLPTPAYINQHEDDFDASFAAGYPAFKALLDDARTEGGFNFEIMGLAPGVCYTAVMTTPNYPSYQTKVCLGVSGSTKTITVDLDAAVGSGATVLGVVKGTDTVTLIPGALVEIIGDGVYKKPVNTDALGAYKFEGLSAGTVKIRVSAGGYALAEAQKDLGGNGLFTQNFFLTAAAGSITGTVYSQKMPFAKVQPGAHIYAYDDTYNGNNPAAALPLIKTKTGSDGTYKLDNLISGDVYKVFLKVPGRYTLNQSVTATAGLVPGIDFTMRVKPLDIEMFGKKGKASYEFTVLNPAEFKDGEANWSASPYNAVAATALNMEDLPGGELRGTIPLASLTPNITYVLRINATSYCNKTVTRDLLFGLGYNGNSNQNIDDAILGDDSDDGKGRTGNEASLDKSGDDASSLVFPAGAMLPISSAAVPASSFRSEGKNDAAVADKVAALGADAFAGNLYTVSLSSVSINADKGFEISLAYDKKSTPDLTDLAVARYNNTTAKWENVPGLATINPVKGTIKVKLKSLASVLAVRDGTGTQQFSAFDGRQYVMRPLAGGGSGSGGTFSVIRLSAAGDDFTGSKIKVFNYPNPFNLKSKTIANSHGADLPGTVNGTVIHVEVPAGNGGPGHVRIYTLAGELVKDLSVAFEAGKYNYVNWDGLNKHGQEVANGVYYGIVKLSGKSPKLKDATFKMVVIK